MTGAVILLALPDDAPSIARVHRAARAAAMPWLEVVHTPDEDVAHFRQHVFAKANVWAAKSGNVVLGFAVRRGDWLDHLYLAPGAWGQGLGVKLLNAARAGQSRVQLWTFQRNIGARRFYEREGFIPAELTDGARNEEREPDIRYTWEQAQ